MSLIRDIFSCCLAVGQWTYASLIHDVFLFKNILLPHEYIHFIWDGCINFGRSHDEGFRQQASCLYWALIVYRGLGSWKVHINIKYFIFKAMFHSTSFYLDVVSWCIVCCLFYCHWSSEHVFPCSVCLHSFTQNVNENLGPAHFVQGHCSDWPV